MTQITFTNQEVAVVLKALQEYESDLRMEIANTDRKAYRDQLKEKKVTLHGVVEKLEQAHPDELPDYTIQAHA